MKNIIFKISLLICASALLVACVEDGVIYTDAPTRVYATGVASPAAVVPSDGYYTAQTPPAPVTSFHSSRRDNGYYTTQTSSAVATPSAPVVGQDSAYSTSQTEQAPAEVRVVKKNKIVASHTGLSSTSTPVAPPQ